MRFDYSGDVVRCVVNDSEPLYQPNVYECPQSSTCCFYRGEASCCGDDVTLQQFFNQAIPFIIGLLVVAFFCKFAQWAFGDDELIDDEKKKGFSVKNYKQYMMAEPFDTVVDDPIFGPCYEQRAPRLAAGGHQKEQ